MTSLKLLLKFCERHGIKPKVKTRVVIEAAIVRWLHDNKEVETGEIGCFGQWSSSDPVCRSCWHEGSCHLASLGYEKGKK